jgi:hypothetical protein
MLSNSIHANSLSAFGYRYPMAVRHGGFAGRVADARTQVRLPNLVFHLNENQRFFGVYLEVVVAAS